MSLAATIHIGPIFAIPSQTSPGLSFLRTFLPILDSLLPNPPFSTVLAPHAVSSINGADPVLFSSILPMFEMRAQRVKKASHDLHRAWEIPNVDGTITLLMDWSSTTILKADEEEKPCVVHEFSVLKLEAVDKAEGEEEGEGEREEGKGLWVTKMETWMDAQPVKERMAEIMGVAEKGVEHGA